MRLFFALWPPEHAAQALAELANSLARQCGGKATRQETIHLTLAFLGEVDEVLLPAAIRAARGVRGEFFELAIDRLGYWRHNRLLWAGCTSPSRELQALVGGLREQLRAVSICCDEKQRFTPHLTLVRKVPDMRAQPDLADIEPMVWPCREFVLVSSRLTPSGSDYTTVVGYPLTGG